MSRACQLGAATGVSGGGARRVPSFEAAPHSAATAALWLVLLGTRSVVAAASASAAGASGAAVAAASATKSAGGLARGASASGWWPLGAGGAQPADPESPLWSSAVASAVQLPEAALVDVPGEGSIQDEALPLLRAPVLLRRASTDAALVGAGGTRRVRIWRPRLRTPAWGMMPPQQSQAVREYDEAAPEPQAMWVRGQSALQPVPDERGTKEDLDRQRAGDFGVVRPAVHVPRPPPRALVASEPVALAAQAPSMKPRERMEAQCMKFAHWVKDQGVQGSELVRLWKGTCEKPVSEGAATAAYAEMCNALGGSVAEFADKPDWTPKAACAAVLRTFVEAGIGGSPLKG